jgi:hypothetical protein
MDRGRERERTRERKEEKGRESGCTDKQFDHGKVSHFA